MVKGRKIMVQGANKQTKTKPYIEIYFCESFYFRCKKKSLQRKKAYRIYNDNEIKRKVKYREKKYLRNDNYGNH